MRFSMGRFAVSTRCGAMRLTGVFATALLVSLLIGQRRAS